MGTNALLSNPVSLKDLKNNYTFENSEINLVLRDDIWLKGILLIRSGKYLTESIVDKLMNFGIREVNVHLNEFVGFEDEINAIRELKKNYIKTQNILIIDRDFKEIKKLIKEFTNIGFSEENISGAIDIKALNRHLQTETPDYLFINHNYCELKNYLSYIRNDKILKNMHIFLTSDESGSKDIKNKTKIFNVKFVQRPVIEEYLENLIFQCVDGDFNRLLNNNTYIMNDYKEA